MHVLVTGATGYIGGRLVGELLDRGHTVRVLVRDASAWDLSGTEVHEGDLLKPETLAGMVDGVDAAYYLVHSMGTRRDFESADATAARNFVAAAKGVKHCIYLGGLQPEGQAESHLRSRSEVGEILRAGLPATEFRAGPVIGSGSASFEMIRYLTERLPVMVTPRWIDNAVRPIAVRDILAYLEAALDKAPLGIVDVGTEAAPFGDLMRRYAEVRGLRARVIWPTPVLAPGLAARWVQFVTPVTNKIAIPLLEGIVHPIVGDPRRSRELFPEIEPIGYDEAVRLALQRTEADAVVTRWTGRKKVERHDWANVIREQRQVDVDASPERVFAILEGLGGRYPWPHKWAWRVRGAFDRAIGGPGLKRGRRSQVRMVAGDAVDWWRVQDLQRPKSLVLAAEMKLPGKAWLRFDVEPRGKGSVLVQTALFEPRGLPGYLYWNGLYLVHALIFSDMVKAIKAYAEQA